MININFILGKGTLLEAEATKIAEEEKEEDVGSKSDISEDKKVVIDSTAYVDISCTATPKIEPKRESIFQGNGERKESIFHNEEEIYLDSYNEIDQQVRRKKYSEILFEQVNLAAPQEGSQVVDSLIDEEIEPIAEQPEQTEQ